ncbi:MAG TPA: hypothetical protein VFF30_17930 [Nitrososphaerales archaeon]|nr:hypothetical protein [Nitrososphaerales archaeon]
MREPRIGLRIRSEEKAPERLFAVFGKTLERFHQVAVGIYDEHPIEFPVFSLPRRVIKAAL